MCRSAGQSAPQLIRTAASSTDWEHNTDIAFPRSPHSVAGCTGALSQARTRLYKLCSVSLLWSSKTLKHEHFPLGSLRQGRREAHYPLVSLHCPKDNGLPLPLQPQKPSGTQDRIPSGQHFISQGFIQMLPPEPHLSYLYYPFSTSPKRLQKHKSHTQ